MKILTYHPDFAKWINRRDECGDSEVRESAASTTLEQGRMGDGRTEEKNEQSKQSTTTRQFEGVSEDVPKEENKEDKLGQQVTQQHPKEKPSQRKWSKEVETEPG